jgi:putative copper export protein
MSFWLEQAVALIHTLSSAAWLGALVYRLCFVDPKAMRSLGDGAKFEKFSLDLAHGMRYVVVLALVSCGLSGFALMGMRWNAAEHWQAMMAAKIALWAIAVGLFTYISWVYWPRRVFADATEWPAVRRQGLRLSLVMIAIAGLGFVVGQLAQTVSRSINA